jgi:exosortase sorting signal-containing protein
MKIDVSMFRKVLLVAVLILTASFFASTTSYSQIVYSHVFEQGVVYTPGTPQYDDWASFRASLPLTGVTSITMSGSRDPVGRACNDPAIAQQIADAMRAGADGLFAGAVTLSLSCGGFIWNTGSCPDQGDTNNLEINVGNDEVMCTCQNDGNWTIRPILIDGDWGGIDGLTCSASTQTMTLVVEGGARPIPTLSEWGLIAMAGVLGIVGFMVIRRRKLTA